MFSYLLSETQWDLWLAALTLSVSSSIILILNYSKSRKTPIGNAALYISISSLIWTIVTITAYLYLGVPNLALYFLFLAFLAGIFTTLGAYERAKIQSILTPSGEERHGSRTLLALSVLVLAIALAGILRPIINSPFLNSAMGSASILTTVGLILISASLIVLSRPEFPKRLIYLLAGAAFTIGFIVLFGYYAVNIMSPLDAFLPGGGTSIETAKGFILASLGVVFATQRGLKAWFAKIILAMGILFVVLSDLYTLLEFHHPVLLWAPSVALSLILIGIAQLWGALKNR